MCVPRPKPMKLIGELQLPYGVESSIAHQNVELGSEDENVNVASRLDVLVGGESVIVVSGAAASVVAPKTANPYWRRE
ncbi:MAG: hypothetical protein E6G67_13840 [Actinobacteria bacterium]|nr:MAG: hypothetical protein E6G67_13840 [Actinomycetota bacterium]